jgi:hypothetical protein
MRPQTKKHPAKRIAGLAATTFECFGARIQVRGADRAILRDLNSFFPPGSRVCQDERPHATFLVQRNSKQGFCAAESGIPGRADGTASYATLAELASEFHSAVAEFARPLLFVHAGVVAWHGSAILLPGRTMSGKSTMVAALIDHGAVYYSDEYAVIDARGRIYSYRKPLNWRTPQGAKRTSAVPSHSNARRTGPLHAGVIAIMKYKQGARWRPRKLTPAEAVMALFDNTVLAQSRAKFALRALSLLAQQAAAIKTLRPDTSLAAPALLDFASKALQERDIDTN